MGTPSPGSRPGSGSWPASPRHSELQEEGRASAPDTAGTLARSSVSAPRTRRGRRQHRPFNPSPPSGPGSAPRRPPPGLPPPRETGASSKEHRGRGCKNSPTQDPGSTGPASPARPRQILQNQPPAPAKPNTTAPGAGQPRQTPQHQSCPSQTQHSRPGTAQPRRARQSRPRCRSPANTSRTAPAPAPASRPAGSAAQPAPAQPPPQQPTLQDWHRRQPPAPQHPRTGLERADVLRSAVCAGEEVQEERQAPSPSQAEGGQGDPP